MRYCADIRQLEPLPESERERLVPVTKEFTFRASHYYLSLINWDDPEDPLRRIVIPTQGELAEFGRLDPSGEAANYVAKGCQHKYRNTALLLVSNACASYCRFCFRKRLFRGDHALEASLDVSPGLGYIASHPEIDNVLLTGGDPLVLATRQLDKILAGLRAIPHVRVIRIGTKVPAFDPDRINGDPGLPEMLARHSAPTARIYAAVNFNHPRELTQQSLRSLEILKAAGVELVHQTPLLRGVNDDPAVLGELLNRLAWGGVHPYYVFQSRPVAGNSGFVVPLRQAYAIVEGAKNHGSGLAKRIRFVMSHDTGKIEVVAVEGDLIYLKYHQARDPADLGRFMVFRLPDGAGWFDDLAPVEPARTKAVK